jgi:DNA-binding CsgD family transcriptional regulator
MRPDIIGIVESIYEVEKDTACWIEGVLSRLEPLVGDGLGLFGITYTVSTAGALVPECLGAVGCPPAMKEELPVALVRVGSDIVDGYLRADAGVTSEFAGWAPSKAAEMARQRGVTDSWFINGRNLGNRGCALTVNRRRPGRLSPKTRNLFVRMALHLAAAHRLRDKLGPAAIRESTEAVLSPDGKVVHAAGVAQARDSLEALSAGAISMDRARAGLRRKDPERALGTWKGLVAARWTLVDRFESDGRRYILARENESDPVARAVLSARERQVVANAALGRSNKEIAYALGLAHSTVRVLLARAARKLRVSTRAELVRRFEALDPAGEENAESSEVSRS